MSIFDSLTGSSTTQPATPPPDNSDVTALMRQATSMANTGGPGANSDAAEQWLQTQLQNKGAQPTKSIFSSFTGDGTNSAYKAPSSVPKVDNAGTSALSLTDPSKHPEISEDPFSKLAEGISSAVASTAAKVGAYFNNFSTLHKTTYKDFSPEQIAAAKQVGIPLPMHGLGQFSILDIGTEKYNELFDRAVRQAGEDPEAIQKTIDEGEKGNLSTSNLANAISQKSLLAQGAKAFFNPSLANTKLYEETQHAAQAIATLKNPDASTEAKKKATYDLMILKAQNGGFTDSLKAMYEQYKKDPMAAAKGMLFSIGETPELAALGGGGDLGKLALGAKTEQASSLAAKAAATASEQIAKARLAEVAGDTSAGLAKSKLASDLAGKALTLKRLQKLGDLAGSAGTGATINAAASAANQYNEKGYVSPGQATLAATTGAALGAGAHILAGTRAEGAISTQESVPSEHTETAQTRQGAQGDINQPHVPGEPIPTNAPVDDTGTVPYTGGAADHLKKTHIDKDFPNTLNYKTRDGKEVTLPVKDIVTQVHEAEEAPLMHPKGPVPVDKVAALVHRAGQYATEEVFSPAILKKINEGKPLTYPEAHEIATVIENNHVHNTYNVEPKEYQEGMKPYIKDIAESSEEKGKGDIPADLDSKPYDDMEHPEVVEGASKSPAVGSIFDSLMKSTQQSGSVDKRLLATGAAAGVGATAGAVLSPEDKKRQGAIAGGLAGLLAGMNMWGESIPTRGLGNRERGMFAGIGARTFRLKDAQFAEAMERAGKGDKEIQLATGMHRNAAGQWQFELSDEGMDVLSRHDPLWKEAQNHSIPLSRVVLHSQLDKAYPGLLNSVKVKIDPNLKSIGSYDPKTKTITLRNTPKDEGKIGWEFAGIDTRFTPKSIFAHEIQHIIQDIEGHPSGSNVSREAQPLTAVRSYLENRQEAVYQKILKAERDGRPTADLDEQYQKIQDQLNGNFTRAGIEYQARGNYGAVAGEVQARNTQARLDLTEAERRETPVEETQDIPYKDQIVRPNKYAASAHEEPLGESLQKTGEMDEEGRLHGMILPEDKLPNEAAVVSRAKDGDQKAITQLFNQYYRRLTNSLKGYMRDAGPRLGLDAEDVASRAFFKAIQNLHSFQGNSSFYTWLYNIARNESLNDIARSNRQVPTETMFNPSVGGGGERTVGVTGREGLDTSGNPIRPSVEAAGAVEHTPEDMFTAQQASNMVQHAISRLPPEIRRAIKLRELEGLSEHEIAQQEGIPVGTVKSRLSRGRDMIQTSIQRGHGANFRKQGGFATPEDMKRLAWTAGLGTLGATVGALVSGPDNKEKSMLVGAGLAMTLSPLVREFYQSPRAMSSRVYRNMVSDIKAPEKENISDTIGRWQAQGKQAEIINYRIGETLKRIVPTKDSRVKVTHSLDTGNLTGLTEGEIKAHKYVRNFLDQMGHLALQNGVIKDTLQNYITHVWKNDEAFKRYQAGLDGQISAAMSGKSIYGLTRKITSLQEGKALGLTPLTEDVNEILHIYTKSVLQAVRNKQFLESLKSTKDMAGKSFLVMPSRKAPANFVQLNHPQLRGQAVHPTIAPELKNVFYSYDLDPLQSAASTLNMAIKRSQVSFSLFHLTSLMDAYSGGMPTFTHPIKTLKGAVQSAIGKSSYHDALRGTASPEVQQMFDRSLHAGVQYQIPRGTGADVDFNNNYYQGLTHLQNYLDQIIPQSGKIPLAVGKVSHAFDHIIFENGMSGMKFSLWMHAVQEMNNSWAAELKRNPSTKVPSQAEIDRTAGGYVNNLLGSQNWLQAAQQATTKLGRGWLNALGSPTGRKLSQYMLFAPDWTTSTFMSFLKALGKGSGVRGLFEPKTTADLHRIYQIRSAALYALIGGGLNYAMSGHYIWDNKDPTTIDMGNGQRLQWNKHWTEPYQVLGGAATGDMQPAYNKLGFLPHEFASQVGGKEYINLRGTSPPMKESRVAHILKGLVPIPFQGFGEQTPAQVMWNLAGRNVLGHPSTGEAARTYREKMAEKKRQETMEAYKERMNQLQEGR